MNLVKLIKTQIENVKEYYDISRKTELILMTPQNQIIVHFPVKLESGEIKIFKGYRVQHNNILGPYKGGLRFHPNVYLDEFNALAFWMTIKCSLQNLPLGGGKGGIKINPYDYSKNDLEKISKNFARSLANYIGEDIDIPAPDVGSNSQMMDWMNDELMKSQNTTKVGNFTGKSVCCNGSNGRTEATGFGVVLCIKEWAIHNNIDLNGKTCCLQGLGNVGSYVAIYLDMLGMKLISVGDHTGYLYNSNGFNVSELVEHSNKNRGIHGYPSEKTITKEEFFKLRCNILVPAALELQITKENADTIDCDVIVEGANGPLDNDADEILKNKNIDIIPDILANSGGVIVSYYEWLQNKSSEKWTKEFVLNKLTNHMNKTFRKVLEIKKENNISYRNASYIKSIKHIDDVYKAKGDIYML